VLLKVGFEDSLKGSLNTIPVNAFEERICIKHEAVKRTKKSRKGGTFEQRNGNP